MDQQSPITSLIDRFGGIRPMARALSITPGAVQGWKSREKIPVDHWQAIAAAAKAQRIAFKMTELLPASDTQVAA
ncbi:MAG TPA: hypothetical protein VF592_03520 [Sphingomonas sp.]|jgi:hypothetical protein|uniref:carph-isopro domain-containing protein n=1 Tax=Sphingomonas sp. TaxID=28214 RepID=UPI002ED9646C